MQSYMDIIAETLQRRSRKLVESMHADESSVKTDWKDISNARFLS